MFDQLVNEAASRFGLPAPRVSALLRELLSLMANGRSGGAEGFIELFRRAGALEVISSWFDGKEGSHLAASQVESALGVGALDSLADASGLPRAAVTSVLTFLLPRVLSRLTPGGALPSSGILMSHARSIQLPAAVALEPDEDDRHHRRWLPVAATALLALVALLWLRGSNGTVEPQVTLINRDGKVSYSGVVRDEATRTAIVDALTTAFGAGNIDGALRIDGSVKRASWLPRLGDLVSAIRTPGVELSLTSSAASLGGWLSPATRQALNGKLRGILGEQTAVRTLPDPAGAAARAANDRAMTALGAIGTSGVSPDALVQAMNLAVINFPPGGAEIPTDNREVIRKSAEAINRAPPGTRIEIRGHTDSTGDATRNLALSLARARAVRTALVNAGVPDSTVTTKGYGDTMPVASNDSEYGRFQNRRIEYAVIARD